MVSFRLMEHEYYMREAVKEALKTVPMGNYGQACIIVHRENIIARAHDTRISDGNPHCYAAMNAVLSNPLYIRDFGHECLAYTVLEPALLPFLYLLETGIRSFYFSIPLKEDSPVHLFKLYPEIRNRLLVWEDGIIADECRRSFAVNDENGSIGI